MPRGGEDIEDLLLQETDSAEADLTILLDGTREWRDPKTGLLHKEGAPARIWADNTSEWYWQGELHREDGPAIIWEINDVDWLHPKAVEEFWLRGKPRHADQGHFQTLDNGEKVYYDGINQDLECEIYVLVDSNGNLSFFQNKNRDVYLGALSDGELISAGEWFIGDEIHRDPNRVRRAIYQLSAKYRERQLSA